ncbi:sensor histidine kinase [Raoultibacter massiliensis]|uniref:sensor histidine kinase n=1 Tax=Raoultibacter massiliensis TaxID=1852371 RepID=UPI003A939768
MEALVAIVVILAVAVAVLCVQLVRSERELRALARYLSQRDSSSNTRVTVSMHSHGFVRLGQAINRQLDRHQGERLAAEEHASEMRRGLTYLSHDIRTPLAGAKGYAQLLEAETDPAAQRRYLTAIGRRIDDASKLLDQLFAYAQVQDPDYRLERGPVEANAVLAETLLALYPQFQEKGWTPRIELESDRFVVMADGEALVRVFRNLAANALRYGADAPTIEQRASTISFSNRVAQPEMIDPARLFERFYQGSDSRSDGNGGLGLAIVSQLCHAMGASVEAELVGDMLTIAIGFEEAAGTR